MINKKLDYNTELMLITMEECGELIVVPKLSDVRTMKMMKE